CYMYLLSYTMLLPASTSSLFPYTTLFRSDLTEVHLREHRLQLRNEVPWGSVRGGMGGQLFEDPGDLLQTVGQRARVRPAEEKQLDERGKRRPELVAAPEREEGIVQPEEIGDDGGVRGDGPVPPDALDREREGLQKEPGPLQPPPEHEQ